MRLELAAIGMAAAAIVSAPGVQAHHPGSHATREPDGQVKIDAVAMASDTCTSIAEIRTGTPPDVAAPPDITPVTVSLRPEGEVCAAAVTAVRAQETLPISPEAKQILLYILAPDGSVAATERVPVR